MSQGNINVVCLGTNGFPCGMAEISRAKLLLMALLETGASVMVISRKGVHEPQLNINLAKEGTHEGVKYTYASGTPYRAANYLKRNILKFFNLISEIYIIFSLHKQKRLDVAILSTMAFSSVLFYRMLSKTLNFPLFLNYVELNSAIPSRKGIALKINDFLFEDVGFHLVDGIIPISHVLENIVKKKINDIHCLRIPVICDFEKFAVVSKNHDKKYFIFCGAAGYLEIIIFVLQSFDQLKNNHDVWLYLVVNGSGPELLAVTNEINKTIKHDLIKTFSSLTDAQLVDLYVNAQALLIPLRPTMQDAARFPHKIGEYTASGNPIITTGYGEIRNYFVDNDSALIADSYDIVQFAGKMQFVLSNPQEACTIGQRGKAVGLKNFNYKNYGQALRTFIDK